MRERISKKQVQRPLAEKRGLDTWEKVVNFTTNEWLPSRLSFGKFKGTLYQEAREDAELRSWSEWLEESTNERSSAMGLWYLGQLENGTVLEDAACLDLEIQEHAGDAVPGLVGTNPMVTPSTVFHAWKVLVRTMTPLTRARSAVPLSDRGRRRLCRGWPR